MATAPNSGYRHTDLDPITVRALDAFRRRRGLLLILRALGVGLLVFISLAFVLATIDYLFIFSDQVRWALSLGIYLLTAIAVWSSGFAGLRKNDELSIARRVESVAPKLRENLVSAIELADAQSANGSPYFRRLLQSRVAKRIAKLDIGELLPLELVRRWLVSGGAVTALCVALMFVPSAQFGRRFARAALPGFAIERASHTKVTIIEPSPPSRYVAQRDAVGVIVEVQNAEPDDVMLHWQSADGTSGETVMTPRLDAGEFQPGANPLTAQVSAGESEPLTSGGRFAANLSVGSVPMQYRITAGDAVTLWHELTPLPRPQVLQFEKRYVFPKYAKLDDRTAEEEHGDLKALQGTTAEVTVTFDQPVENAMIRFGVRGTQTAMEPVDDSGTRYMTRISIKTSGQYQVDATSVRSGLNNPFSPTNMISPVLDTPPVIRWGKDVESSQLVSALDVIDLAALVMDDLPLETVNQQVRVNSDALKSYSLPIDVANRKIELDWDWDLLNRLGEGSDTAKLKAGDVVHTRLVAIDRKGTRTESEVIEFLIADDGFDADRHEFLEPLAAEMQQVIQWAESCEQLARQLETMAKEKRFDELDQYLAQWKELQANSVKIINGLSATLKQTGNPVSAAMCELVGRGVLDLDTRLDGLNQRLDFLRSNDSEKWKRSEKSARERVKGEFSQAAYQAERLRQFAQTRFSLALTAAIYADVSDLRRRIDRLADRPPDNRLSRYFTLISGQIDEINRLIQRYEPLMNEHMDRHLSGSSWGRWAQSWRFRLEQMHKDRVSVDQALAVLETLQREIKDKPQHVVYSGNFNNLLRWGRDLRKEMGYLSDLTRRAQDAGNRFVSAQAEVEREKNAEAAIEKNILLQWNQLSWSTELNRLVVRTAGQEKLNRSKLKVDLQYAADQNLFLRAIRNVTKDGYQPYKDEPAAKVMSEIGRAISTLQGASDLAAAKENLLAIRDGERQPDGSPLRKLYHPVWFRLQDIRIELGVRYLRQSQIDWTTFLQSMDQTRYNDDHTQANARMDSRQWRLDPFVSAGKPILAMVSDLGAGLDSLVEQRAAAREVLSRYVLKLSEQARQAAESAEEAKQQTDERPDSAEKSADEIRPEQDDALQQATETIQSLIDRANTTDIFEDAQREVARDADAAAELIAEEVRQTKEALRETETAASDQQRDQAMEKAERELGELADRLNQTAEHFEKIENGEDVTESRQQLRDAEQDLENARQLQQRYEQADQMSETAKQDPRELLQQLEQELKRSEPMQDALSEIASELVDDAIENLNQASDEEDNLARKLETDDDAFAEQKLQQRGMLAEFVERAKTLRDKTLSTTSQAAGWANQANATEKTEAIRKQISNAVQSAEQGTRSNSTLREIQQATRDLAKALSEASAQSNAVADELAKATDQDLHGDQKSRDRTESKMRDTEGLLKNSEVKASDSQRARWNSIQRQANSRINNFQRRARQTEQQRKREQDRLKKEPDNESRKQEIEKLNNRIDEFNRAAEQARQTKQLATDRMRAADQRIDSINRSKAKRLEKPNPAAQLGERVARDAKEQLDALAQELGDMNDDTQIASDLRTPVDSTNDLSRRQQSVARNIDTASEDLERASRHEARLENPETAQQLSMAAEATDSRAGTAAEQANQSIEQAIEQANQANQAVDSLQDASDQIDAQANAIAAAFKGSTENQGSPSPSGQPTESQQPATPPSADASMNPAAATGQPGQTRPTSSGEPQQGMPPSGDLSDASPQQKAQTLDELDRSLSSQSKGQPGEPNGSSVPGEGQQQNSSQSGQGEAGQPSESDLSLDQSDGPPGDAMKLSPTLAQMLEAQLQQAARERMKSLQQAQQGQSSDQASANNAASNPVSESGQGEAPPGNEEIDLMREITDGAWGELRQRGVEDAVQGRGVQIPPGYSREVQAYFKALSKRAAEAEQ